MSAARTAHQQSLSRCVIIYDDNLSYRSLYIFFFIFFFLSLFERKTVATYCATCCERFKMCLLNENLPGQFALSLHDAFWEPRITRWSCCGKSLCVAVFHLQLSKTGDGTTFKFCTGRWVICFTDHKNSKNLFQKIHKLSFSMGSHFFSPHHMWSLSHLARDCDFLRWRCPTLHQQKSSSRERKQ